MRIKPLLGQVLIEVLPPETKTAGGVDLPEERPLSPEFVEETHRDPVKPAKNHIGIVRACGPWPKTKNGLLRMPEFGLGQKVVFNPFTGTELTGRGHRLRMVRQDDVLAVLT